jgi:hypothetical protein
MRVQTLKPTRLLEPTGVLERTTVLEPTGVREPTSVLEPSTVTAHLGTSSSAVRLTRSPTSMRHVAYRRTHFGPDH